MAFIISKKSKRGGKEKQLYYMVRNYREGNKIKRSVIWKLGESSNLQEALSSINEHEKTLLNQLQELENRLERVKRGDSTAFYAYCPPYRQVSRITERLSETRIKLENIKEKQVKLEELIQQFSKCSANNY